MSIVLRKLFVAGSGVTALFFLYLTYHEAQATGRDVLGRDILGWDVSQLQNESRAPNDSRVPNDSRIHDASLVQDTKQASAQALSATQGAGRFAGTSGGEKKVVFATVWGQTLAQDGTGFYNELAGTLLQPAGADVSYQLMPYKRARARFLDHAGSCLYPSNIDVLMAGGHIDDRDDFVATAPLFTARTHVFSRGGEAPPRTMADLSGKTVAVPSGSVMQQLLKGSGATILSVHDEVDKAHMLLSGRVDYMTAMLPDAVLVFAAMGKPLPEFDPGMPFLEAGISLVCHRSEDNMAFVNALDARIGDMNADPSYRARLFDAGIWQGEALADEALAGEAGRETGAANAGDAGGSDR